MLFACICIDSPLYLACKSMQNIQCLSSTGNANKYVFKYVGKIDENNHVIVRAHTHDSGKLISQSTFLHNTKISSSAINEKRHYKIKEVINIQWEGKLV